jgi:group I intron endonuclease
MQTYAASSFLVVRELKDTICITDMNIGIYKWVSPTGRIYVGQSTNIKQRKEWYLSNGISNASMPKLKRSFNKYGIENHLFEIIEYCSIEKLNEREIYWGVFYNTLENGLNCKLGEQNCIFSEETKNKMSVAKKNKPLSIEHQLNKVKSLKKFWDMKKEIKEKLDKVKKIKYIPTKEHRENISKAKKGKSIHNEQSKQKLSEVGKLRDMKIVSQAGAKARKIPVLQFDLDNNFIKEYPSSNDAERILRGKKGDNIRSCIRGKQKTAYGFLWKEK